MQPVQRWLLQHADAERADAAGMNCLLMLMSMHGLMQPVRSVEMTRTAMTSFSCFIVMVVLLLVTFFPPSLTPHPTHTLSSPYPHARSLTKRRVIVSVFVPCRRADAAGAVSCFVLVLLHTAFLFTHATVSDIIRIYASDVGLMQPVRN